MRRLEINKKVCRCREKKRKSKDNEESVGELEMYKFKGSIEN
jgi:hypothetical protein